MSVLKILGIIYLCWMAWKIANDSNSPNSKEDIRSKPFTFFQSLIYPWLNPKAWIVYTSMISIFVTSSKESFSQIIIMILFIFVGLLIASYVWSFGGIILKRFLKNEKFIKRLNQTMAILLVLSVLPIII